MFETALRNKFRFPFKGQITTEDLWDLSLNELDSIYKTLNKEVKARAEESLLTEASTAQTDVDVKIEIIKHIADVKKKELEAKLLEVAKKAEREKVAAILAEKQDEALKNLSVEELKAMLDNL